eukprot:TRINITY_DN66817_c10_g8_i1.p1 TRINITY_DN66817_c10_g8~~TRINITY_DN66817_c10_g8_i1.p1  ORF type:complete len:130 (-),score=13.09 TRINITY_DN66817_c10_g8_i1:117-506(-)
MLKLTVFYEDYALEGRTIEVPDGPKHNREVEISRALEVPVGFMLLTMENGTITAFDKLQQGARYLLYPASAQLPAQALHDGWFGGLCSAIHSFVRGNCLLAPWNQAGPLSPWADVADPQSTVEEEKKAL